MCQATAHVPSETRQDQTWQPQVGTPVRIMPMYAIDRGSKTLRVSEAPPTISKLASSCRVMYVRLQQLLHV
jgi:hypothetical protein